MSNQPEAMEMAEAARQTDWESPSFIAELFMGKFRYDLISPYPNQPTEDKAIGDNFLEKLGKFLKQTHDPDALDRETIIKPEVLQGLKELGCFGIKIPTEYGGLGFSQVNYNRIIAYVSSYCVNLAVLLSAHQSIGVPVPLKMFGTQEQKEKYYPRLAKGAISAFALTEPAVGSDPAKMTTTATLSEDGEHYIINGDKLWCTNGTIAELILVMAITSPKKITAFIVEANTPGFEVVHRCDFMGMRGIQNGLLRFKDVKIPKENMIGQLGGGLKLALTTLNTGRLTLPSSCCGGLRQALNMTRDWANQRVQWGKPIGKHDAVANRIAKIASHLYAMEAVSLFSARLVDIGGFDIRLEAAMSKLFNTELGWELVDSALQIRGGRGFEKAESLKARGEKPYPIERMLRDSRINRILEGSTEIMHLFIARELLDQHMKLAAAILDPKSSFSLKIQTFFKASFFYLTWYPKQWLPWKGRISFGSHPLGHHLRFAQRRARKLARSVFHILMLHQMGLQNRQVLLARVVNIAMDLFAMSVTCTKTASDLVANPDNKEHLELANHFCIEARDRINKEFKGLYWNNDKLSYKLARHVLDGKLTWLEDEIIPLFDDAKKVDENHEKKAS